MSFFSKLAKIAGIAGGAVAAPFTGGASLIPTITSAAGAALGGAAEASAKNRGTALEAELAAEQASLARLRQYQDFAVARERDKRESASDALRKAQTAAYIANNQGYKAPTITTSGKAKTLGSFNFGPAASTPEEIAAANAVRAEAEKRLTAGDSLLPAAVDPGRRCARTVFRTDVGRRGR